MARYRKLPILVEAIQWTGKSLFDARTIIQRWAELNAEGFDPKVSIDNEGSVNILLKDGLLVTAKKGDWVIVEKGGLIYTRPDEIFHRFYERDPEPSVSPLDTDIHQMD